MCRKNVLDNVIYNVEEKCIRKCIGQCIWKCIGQCIEQCIGQSIWEIKSIRQCIGVTLCSCKYCQAEFEGAESCSCFQARKRSWQLKGPHAEPLFVRCSRWELWLSRRTWQSRCRFCNSEVAYAYDLFDSRLPPI